MWEGLSFTLGPRDGLANVPRLLGLFFLLSLPADQLSILVTEKTVSEGLLAGGAVQILGYMVGMFLSPRTTALRLSQNIPTSLAGWNPHMQSRGIFWKPEFIY